MKTLFNDGWEFRELPFDEKEMTSNGEKNILSPEDFLDKATQTDYKSVSIPHDWQIYHVKDLYKNSVGFYKKVFSLSEQEVENKHVSVRFEGVYMNCGVWINGKPAGQWKYGYSAFEFDISDLIIPGKNLIQVFAVYQNCNTRWYSGAGIFRDVWLNITPKTYIVSDGIYIVNTFKDNKWHSFVQTEIAGPCEGFSVITSFIGKDKKELSPLNTKRHITEQKNQINQNSVFCEDFDFKSPELWSPENPFYYTAKTKLFDENGKLIDETSQHCGFRTITFDKNKGLFVNNVPLKIQGVCQHHDLGALGSAFNKNALKRQFSKLKEMGVNAIRCSHNPPPTDFMNLADEMGFLIDDECFDMWELNKTPYDYANFFTQWHEKDVSSWVRKDRNHPSLMMWSIGNEIYDTHQGNGLAITKELSRLVRIHDPEKNGLITIASNYMMSENAQKCAEEIDVVGYNYLERLYDEHHKNHPDWKIYGSETSSTVQSRGIYHFPLELGLVTYNDGQCSCLGNCTTPWGAKNTETVITWERDCKYSAGQFIWTGWDYIGEPTPYHSKNSYFGQIDTAGFPKDTFFLYKALWAGKKTAPFVHILPYWDWNEGQQIDVKVYSNCDSIELFYNGNSLGRQSIDFVKSPAPYGLWKIEYHKGEIKAVGYDSNGNTVAVESKKSFSDPEKIVLAPEPAYGDLFFIDIYTVDKNGTPVENARNYITFKVSKNAKLLGMDNGDSTDFDEYKANYFKQGRQSSSSTSPSSSSSTSSSKCQLLTRKLFNNHLIAIVQYIDNKEFTISAASAGLQTVCLKYSDKKFISACEKLLKPENDFIPVRKIELTAHGSKKLSKENPELIVTAEVLPKNASCKKIDWNAELKECVKSDNVQIYSPKNLNTPSTEHSTEKLFQKENFSETVSSISGDIDHIRLVQAAGDGDCILRCTTTNGTTVKEIISDLPLSIHNMGNPYKNPYELIEACRHENWDKTRKRPEITLESGSSNMRIGPTWLSFDRVDFGSEGSSTIHIPIFSFLKEVPLEIWDGEPDEGTEWEGAKSSSKTNGKCLGKFVYKHESVYNTYFENVFELNHRLFGVHKITIVLLNEVYLHGFYFEKSQKATSKLNATDATLITGDSFKIVDSISCQNNTNDYDMVNYIEQIGNNVIVDFDNMDFGEKQISGITICGKSNTKNNTINIKFFDENGNSTTSVIDFAFSEDFTEKSFELKKVSGKKKISFIFLPGSNFDFKWFKFF